MKLQITDITNQGLGVARLPDGRVVMVSNALPGETVEAEITSQRKGFALAACQEVLSPSTDRIEPLCPWFGQCGGCDLQHLSYLAQIQAKKRWLEQAMRKLSPLPAIKVVASPKVYEYRHRLRLHYSIVQEETKAGFYAKSSHQLVQVADCWLATRTARTKWRQLREINLPGLLEAEILAGDDDNLWLSLLGKSLKAGNLHLPGVQLLWPGQKQDLEQGATYYQQEHFSMQAWPGQFSQVNWEVNRELISNLLRLSAPYTDKGLVVDLFSGSGNLSLPLAHAGASVWAVEGNAFACAAGRHMAARQGLVCRFSSQPVARFLDENKKLGPGLLIMDPPRAGAKGLMSAVAEMKPKAMIYVSCHPSALARDALDLQQYGYAFAELVLLDMFPQTGQMECLALLEKE